MADIEITAEEALLVDSTGKPIIPVVGNTLPEMNDETKNKFLTNNGEDASWDDVPPATEVTYANGNTATLVDVRYQTQQEFNDRTTFPLTQMDVVENIGDANNPLYFHNVKSIAVGAKYTYQYNGTFCTSSSNTATVTITKDNQSVTLYGNTIRIPRGCTFTTTVAGRFFFDDNYYGYNA